jgi:YidC/Oxa1 family membrane protein insertase
MDNIRLFLWMALLAMLWFTYSAWVADYSPPAAPPSSSATPTTQATPAGGTTDELPPLTPTTQAQAAPAAPTETAPPASAPVSPEDLVHVRTDVLDVRIDLRGGDLVRADLPKYPVDKHRPDKLVRLLDFEPDDQWVFRTGLRGVDDEPSTDSSSVYRSAAKDYVLAAGQNELKVVLDLDSSTGSVVAKKVYTFRRGRYAVDLDMVVKVADGGTWRGQPYAQMLRLYVPVKRSYSDVDTYSFRGPVLYDGDRYTKLKFDDIAKTPVMQTLAGGWFAAIQHHFLAATVPPADDTVQYRASTRGQDFVLSAVGGVKDVSSSAPLDYRYELFVGPKLQDQLAAVTPSLRLTVDYGRILGPLARPLFWLLSHVEAVIGNWGWAIIIVTFMIKLAFYKLTQTSGRSAAKMRRLAPRMKALQERYKDDRTALSQHMMELYKREKVNPAAGCLPIVIQMPFFFAFYWVLIESVEMRQAPFMFWLDDLSAHDPYYVLPVINAVVMFLQQRMNPAPPDPIQAKVLQIVPLVFAGFSAFFPSGLVLYWITNTSLSILQQWRINKVVARESAAAAS